VSYWNTPPDLGDIWLLQKSSFLGFNCALSGSFIHWLRLKGNSPGRPDSFCVPELLLLAFATHVKHK